MRNGPDLDRLVPAAPDPRFRNGRDHLLGYVGTMGPQDGVDHLIRALDVLVHDQDRDVQAVLVGDGPELESLRTLAVELKLADHVTFTGSRRSRSGGGPAVVLGRVRVPRSAVARSTRSRR